MPANSATSDSQLPDGAYAGWSHADRMLLLALVGLALLRSLALVISPLELGVDEAQYWLWSTGFDFGYYTKPPLTSWIIGLSHTLFGHHEWAVRLPAAWLHLATALCLWRAAFWLAGPGVGPLAGRLAAIIWMTLPTVALGSFVMSTDTPLLLCWSAGLMALVGVITGQLPQTRGMALAGAAFGAATRRERRSIGRHVHGARAVRPRTAAAVPSMAAAAAMDLVRGVAGQVLGLGACPAVGAAAAAVSSGVVCPVKTAVGSGRLK